MPLKKLICFICLLISGVSCLSQGSGWFREDGVSIDVRGMYPYFKTDTSLTFIITTKFRGSVNFKTTRVRSSIENSSYRFRVKGPANYADTLDMGATSMPGIYEIIIDKIRDSILVKTEGERKIRYADTIGAWYNLLVFNQPTPKDTFKPIYNKTKPLFSNSSWAILDSMMIKMNTDSVNKSISDSIKSFADSVHFCNEEKVKYAQYAVIINNSTESFYKLNSVTVIIDSSCGRIVLPLDTIRARLCSWLLDTSSKAIDKVTLDKLARQKLSDEIMAIQANDIDVIYSFGYVEKYLRKNKIEIGFWRKKYFISTKQGKFFRQINFVGKEPVKIKEPGSDQPLATLDLKLEKQVQAVEIVQPEKAPVNKPIAPGKDTKPVKTKSLEILSTGDNIFNEARQFSSLAAVDDQIWSFGERCNEVAKFDLNGNYVGSRGLLIDSMVQIEAACTYGKYILLLDETPHETGVYFLDTSSFVSYKVLLPQFDYSDDVMGVEGIAVNIADNKCYILREKNSARRSVVKQYDIRKDGDSFKLDYLEGKDLVFSYSESDIARYNCRYTDLYYAGNQLYLLGSRYNENSEVISQYYIDKISHQQRAGIFEPLSVESPARHYYDLTSEMRGYINSHSTNLEGLVLAGNDFFYIISDNVQGEKACTDKVKKGTLFFRFERPLIRAQ